MAKTLFDNKYKGILKCLIDARKHKPLTQEAVAKQLRKPQSFVSKYERGERRLDILEFLEVCELVGLDPCEIIQKVVTKNSIGKVSRVRKKD